LARPWDLAPGIKSAMSQKIKNAVGFLKGRLQRQS
jgi:hypothetical protein